MVTVYISNSGSDDYTVDGAADNVQINAALAYANTNGTPSAPITTYLRGPYTYDISAQLFAGSNTILTGDTTAVLRLHNSASWGIWKPIINQIGGLGTATQNFEMSNITLDGNYANQPEYAASQWGDGYYPGLYFAGTFANPVRNVNIHDMTIKNTLTDGVRLSYANGINFYKNKTIECMHEGIFVMRSLNAEVYNNDFTVRTNSGGRCYNSQNVRFYNNTTRPYALNSLAGGFGFQIEDNSIDSLITTNNIECFNNTITNGWCGGIWCVDVRGTATNKNIKIHDNTITGSGLIPHITYNAGITIQGFNGIEVYNNVIKDCYNAGILVASAPSGGSGYIYHLDDNVVSGTKDTLATSSAYIGAGHGCGIVNRVPSAVSIIANGNIVSGSAVADYYQVTNTNDVPTTPPVKIVPAIRINEIDEIVDYYIDNYSSYVNGYPIKILGYESDTDQSISTDKPPGFDGWVLGDFGSDGASINLRCFGYGKEDVRRALASWKRAGRTYVELGGDSTGWQVSGICRNHSARRDLDAGDTVGEAEPYKYNIVFYCDTPFEESVQKHVRARKVTYSGEQWSSDNVYAGNIIKNPSFEEWTQSTTQTWETSAAAADNEWRCVRHAPELSQFCAVAATGTADTLIQISSDGDSWAIPSGITDAANCNNQWRGLTWGSSVGVDPLDAENMLPGAWVATSITGTGNRVITSVDGVTWIERTSAADNNWGSVCYIRDDDEGIYRYVAVAYSGSNRVMYSDDGGESWTAVASADETNLWLTVCYSDSLKRVVALAYNGTAGYRAMYSDDYGETWTIAATPADQFWTNVIWVGYLGLFVAVSESGTQRVMTSPDGETWTLQTTPATAVNEWRSITCAPELQLLVVVAQSGTGNRVMSSPDAVTWTAGTSALDKDWTSLCFASNISKFVAVGKNESGIASAVMSSDNYGRYTDIAPDGWTLVTAGQARSEVSQEGVLALCITGDGSEETPGMISQPVQFEAGVTYSLTGFCQKVGAEGSGVIDIFSNSQSLISLEWSPEGGYSQLQETIKFEVSPVDAEIRVYGSGTPPGTTQLYIDNLCLQKLSDFEIDDVGNDIATTGTVATIPDISIEAQGSLSGSVSGGETAGETNVWLDSYYVGATSYTTYQYEDFYTHTYPEKTGVKYRVDALGIKGAVLSNGGISYSRIEIYFGASKVATYDMPGCTTILPSYTTRSVAPALTSAAGQSVTLKYYLKAASSAVRVYNRDATATVTEILSTPTVETDAGVSVFNVSDPLTQMRLCNKVFPGLRLAVNADGTGSMRYSENFSDATYQTVVKSRSGDTYSSTLKQVSLTGSLVWEFDSLNPMTGIPYTIIYVISGIPKLQISLDNATWYDCDSNTGDSITTTQITRELDKASGLRLNGQTKFYLKLAPASGTLVIGSIYMFSWLITIDAEHPKIDATGEPNVFEVAMTNDVPCVITLKFPDRHWVG